MAFEELMDVLNAAVDDCLATTEEQAVVHTPAAVGAPVQTGLAAIVQQPFEAESSARGTKLTVSLTASSFVTAPVRGDGLSLGAVNYLIGNINADDGGRLELTLERV